MEEKKISYFFDEEIEEISDAQCAEELQLQEALQASFDNLKISSNEGEEDAESSGFFCGICMERKESGEMFKNNACSHPFCSDCMGAHIQAKIDELNTHPAVTCPFSDPKCLATIELSSCKSILPEGAIARWERLLTESSVDASERIYCPNSDCSEMLVYEDKQQVITEAECPFCWRLFCAQCRVPWHTDQDCDEYRKSEEMKKGDLQVEEMARNFKWMKCPHCNYVVEKIDGCIHMTCRCRFEFCYVCGSTWDESHWDCQTENDEEAL